MNEEVLDSDIIERKPVYVDDLKATERLKSMLLDHLLTSMIILPPVILLDLIGIGKGKLFDDIIMLLIFGIFLNKDIIGGRSLAKRNLGQIVIDKETEMPANEIKCAIRNFTIMLWPIEVIIVMFNPNRRIGDLIAGTKTVRTDKEDIKNILTDLKNTAKINWFLPFVIAIFYVWIFFQVV